MKNSKPDAPAPMTEAELGAAERAAMVRPMRGAKPGERFIFEEDHVLEPVDDLGSLSKMTPATPPAPEPPAVKMPSMSTFRSGGRRAVEPRPAGLPPTLAERFREEGLKAFYGDDLPDAVRRPEERAAAAVPAKESVPTKNAAARRTK